MIWKSQISALSSVAKDSGALQTQPALKTNKTLVPMIRNHRCKQRYIVFVQNIWWVYVLSIEVNYYFFFNFI
jgi:hypothetical protein